MTGRDGRRDDKGLDPALLDEARTFHQGAHARDVYGRADDQSADPTETICRSCGRLAMDHTASEFSIYGQCPAPGPDSVRIVAPFESGGVPNA